MNERGWIKLYRELIDKPIWLNSTPEQRVILITLMCMANHKPKKWEWQGKPYEVKVGQFITSLPKIAEKCNCKSITTQKIRTALARFEKLGFLTDKSTNKNRRISIVNWEVYQGFNEEENRQTNRQIAGKEQADGRQITSNKNVKNDKECKNEKKESVYKHDYEEYKAGTEGCFSFTPPTVSEVTKYCNGAGIKIDCERFVNHYNSIGWRVNGSVVYDWKARVRNWHKQDQQKVNNEKSSIFSPKGTFNSYKQKIYSKEEIDEILKRKGNF